MLTLYFSGTGNTKYIAEKFSETIQADCFSIEEEADFQGLITRTDTIIFCYPVYGSCVPLIMREFVIKHKLYLHGKKIIILCTQNLFSGDGARVFTDLLTGLDYHVIYAEHFNMPNNICNLFFYPLSNEKKINNYVIKAEKKIKKTCENIKNGITIRRGFNIFSKYLGFFTQRIYFVRFEPKAKIDVRVDSDCTSCWLCIEICPMKNLENKENKVIPKGKCTLCYRCVNKCPGRAITVLRHEKVKKQYADIDNILTIRHE